MLSKGCLLICVLIIIINVNAQPFPSQSIKPSEVNLTIIPDKHDVILNTDVYIYFNFTNIETKQNAIAKDIKFKASLSKSLSAPKETLRIENNNKKNLEGDLEISSDFNNYHADHGDWATIDPDGIVEIHLVRLEPQITTIIKYRTKYIDKTEQNQHKICNIDVFEWDRSKPNISDPFIDQIKRSNLRPMIELFNIIISPIGNIISWNLPRCTVFNGSKFYFINKSHDPDNDPLSTKYIVNKIDCPSSPILVENGSKLIDIGTHQFKIIVTDLKDESSLNNSTCFDVVDLVEYHKNLISDGSMVTPLGISLLLLVIIGIFIKRSNILIKRARLVIYLILPVIIIVQICIYYYYFVHPYSYYKSLVWLESGGLIIAFLIFLLYILCVGESCTPLNRSEFCKAIVGMLIAVICFHWLLPNILSQKILYTVLLATFLNFMYLIIIHRNKIANTLNPKSKSNDRISMITIMVAEIGFISVSLYLTMPTPAFKPRFDFSDLIIIEIMEVSLLIMIVACGLHPGRLAETLKSEVSAAKILFSKLFG